MSIDPFVANPPATPLLDKMAEGIGKGLDHLINEKIIGGLGKCLDACSAEVRGLGKAGIDIGSSKLAGGLDSAPPLTPDKSPGMQQAKGESAQIAQERVPERVRDIVKDMPSAQFKGFEVASVSGHDYGNLAPTAVSAGVAQTQSQGYGIG